MALLAGVAALLPLSPALAEEAAADAGDSDTIVVTGQRPIAESEAAALEVKRRSDSLVTVAAADSVGRLPHAFDPASQG